MLDVVNVVESEMADAVAGLGCVVHPIFNHLAAF